MSDKFIIGVPAEESDDLSLLANQLGTSHESAEQRYFDGAAYVEVIVPMVLSAAAWATLRTWIRARAEIRKATRVAYKGVEITAMSAKDSERIISMLSDKLTVKDGDK